MLMSLICLYLGGRLDDISDLAWSFGWIGIVSSSINVPYLYPTEQCGGHNRLASNAMHPIDLGHAHDIRRKVHTITRMNLDDIRNLALLALCYQS